MLPPLYASVTPTLSQYVAAHIIPRYDAFDAAHRRDHVITVIARSMALAETLDVRPDLVYATAAYHDLGLVDDRTVHHLSSGRIVRADAQLRKWFSPDEVELMAQAVEDHRASNAQPPRSLYGMIVAEADRVIEVRTVIRRALQYGLAHHPALNQEEQFLRMQHHVQRKYGEGGYLHCWLPQSPNAAPLAELRKVIADEVQLRQLFDQLYAAEVSA